jgi:hypothetical protein
MHMSWMLLTIGACGFAAIAYAMAGFHHRYSGDPRPSMVDYAGAPAVMVAWWLLWVLLRTRWYRWASARCVRFGHCPACGYDIRGIPAAPDGCTVCPECGAAWKPDP